MSSRINVTDYVLDILWPTMKKKDRERRPENSFGIEPNEFIQNKCFSPLITTNSLSVFLVYFPNRKTQTNSFPSARPLFSKIMT